MCIGIDIDIDIDVDIDIDTARNILYVRSVCTYNINYILLTYLYICAIYRIL